MKRNLLATLVFSQGVPMLAAGDEMGLTQLGNNNAYCQDNETSWVDWDLDEPRRALLAFTTQVLAIRRSQPQLRRERFFDGQSVDSSGLRDVVWFRPDGVEMAEIDWHDDERRVLGMFTHGFDVHRTKECAKAADALFVVFNSASMSCECRVPAVPWPGRWRELLDTAENTGSIALVDRVIVSPQSVVLLAFERE